MMNATTGYHIRHACVQYDMCARARDAESASRMLLGIRRHLLQCVGQIVEKSIATLIVLSYNTRRS